MNSATTNPPPISTATQTEKNEDEKMEIEEQKIFTQKLFLKEFHKI